jgi:hypothetical protein
VDGPAKTTLKPNFLLPRNGNFTSVVVLPEKGHFVSVSASAKKIHF